MFEDLVKIAALGYVGSKMSQEISKRTDERKREQAEAIQQLKNFAFVVYDGKAPYTAAQNLVKYLEDKGYESPGVVSQPSGATSDHGTLPNDYHWTPRFHKGADDDC